MVGRDGAAETVAAQTVTPQFFEVLGVTAIAGRTFIDADDGPNPQAIVLSERFWKRRFDADLAIVGRTITLDERPQIVVGIVAESFQFIRPASIWRLLPQPRPGVAGPGRGQCPLCRLLQVVARLKPGVSINAGKEEFSTLANAVAQQNGDSRRPRRVAVTPFRDVLIGRDLRVTASLFLGVVGFVLILCCANVANLALTRVTVRQRELQSAGRSAQARLVSPGS